MVYIEPTILSTKIEHPNHNEHIRNKDKKQDKSQKRNFK